MQPILNSTALDNLIKAIKENDTNEVSNILTSGAISKDEFDKQDEDGRTLLMIASMYGNLFAVKFLLDNKADVNHKDRNGLTALHFAASNNHVEVFDALINANADINSKDNHGWTPLYSCISCFELGIFDDIEIIQHIIMLGADIDACDNNGNTALISLVKFLSNSYESLKTINREAAYDYSRDNAINLKKIEDKLLPAIKLLIDNGCNKKIINNKGETAFSINKHPLVAGMLMIQVELMTLKNAPKKIQLEANKVLARKLFKDNTQFVIDNLLKASLESLKIVKINLKDAKNFDMLSSVVNEFSEVLPLLAAHPEYIQYAEYFDKAANQIRQVAAIMGDETAERITSSFASYDEVKEAPKMLFSSTPYIRIQSDDEVVVEEKSLSPRPIG